MSYVVLFTTLLIMYYLHLIVVSLRIKTIKASFDRAYYINDRHKLLRMYYVTVLNQGLVELSLVDIPKDFPDNNDERLLNVYKTLLGFNKWRVVNLRVLLVTTVVISSLLFLLIIYCISGGLV